MTPLKLGLLIAAFLLFVLAAFGVTHSRVNLTAMGLAVWVLSLIVP
jgi:hypothetical protein